MTRRKGFTLLELLVVIAIIVILAGILFPVLAKAKEKALATRCLSNIKQLNLALQMYVQDNGNMLPQWFDWYNGNAVPWRDWAISVYYDDPAICKCPSNTEIPYCNLFAQYGINHNICPEVCCGWEPYRQFTAIKKPSKCLLMADSIFGWVMYTSFLIDWWSPAPCISGTSPDGVVHYDNRAPRGVHYGTRSKDYMDGICNVSFVDGHAEARKADTLSQTALAFPKKDTDPAEWKRMSELWGRE